MAGSGRARRFRQARELKQGSHEQVCSLCHANLTLGEIHELECDNALVEDPWAVDGETDDEDEDEEEAW